MMLKEGGVWKIRTLDLEHNHQLCPRERDQLFSGHKYMTEMKKGLIKTLNDNNISTRKMVSILSYLRVQDYSSTDEKERYQQLQDKAEQRS